MTAASPARVLIVDAHRIVRQGLRLLIESEEVAVVADTGFGVRAVELCTQLSPDVVLVDPALPDLTGAEVVRRIQQQVPRIRVIALAARLEGKVARDLLAAGACGYLLKSIDRRGLLDAIRGAMDGRVSVEPTVVSLLTSAAQTLGGDLTSRERQVLNLVARGMSNKLIAKELDLSPGTVRVYLTGIFVKLGVASRTEAALVAHRRGLVAPEAETAAEPHYG